MIKHTFKETGVHHSEFHNETANTPFQCQHCSVYNEKGKLVPFGFERYRIICISCRKQRKANWSCPRCTFQNVLPFAQLGIMNEYKCEMCVQTLHDPFIEIHYLDERKPNTEATTTKTVTASLDVIAFHICPFLYPYDVLHLMQIKRFLYQKFPLIRSREVAKRASENNYTLLQAYAYWETNYGKQACIKNTFFVFNHPLPILSNMDSFFSPKWLPPLVLHILDHKIKNQVMTICNPFHKIIVKGRLDIFKIEWKRETTGNKSLKVYFHPGESIPVTNKENIQTSFRSFYMEQLRSQVFGDLKEYLERGWKSLHSMKVKLNFIRPYDVHPDAHEPDFYVCSENLKYPMILTCKGMQESVFCYGKIKHSSAKTEVTLFCESPDIFKVKKKKPSSCLPPECASLCQLQ